MSDTPETPETNPPEAQSFHLIYVGFDGAVDVTSYSTQDELVASLRNMYTVVADNLTAAQHRHAKIIALHGKLLPITGDKARVLTGVSGEAIELHPGPATPETTEPFAMVPEAWFS